MDEKVEERINNNNQEAAQESELTTYSQMTNGMFHFVTPKRFLLN